MVHNLPLPIVELGNVLLPELGNYAPCVLSVSRRKTQVFPAILSWPTGSYGQREEDGPCSLYNLW